MKVFQLSISRKCGKKESYKKTVLSNGYYIDFTQSAKKITSEWSYSKKK
jgi:hypothetical protein